jgi:hypothetical protein
MVRHNGCGCYHAPEIETIVEPDGIRNDIWWGGPAGIDGVYNYSLADSTNFSKLSCQYRLYVLIRRFYQLWAFNLALPCSLVNPLSLHSEQKRTLSKG